MPRISSALSKELLASAGYIDILGRITEDVQTSRGGGGCSLMKATPTRKATTDRRLLLSEHYQFLLFSVEPVAVMMTIFMQGFWQPTEPISIF